MDYTFVVELNWQKKASGFITQKYAYNHNLLEIHFVFMILFMTVQCLMFISRSIIISEMIFFFNINFI